MSSGIYSIKNKINNKYYYGSSNNIEKRWKQHKYRLNKNNHSNIHLQNAWNKYGEDMFVFEIVENISCEELVDVEQQYLNWMKIFPKKLFYNISVDSKCPNRGRKVGPHSEESKQKMRISAFGRKMSDESKLKISQSRIGKYSGNSHPMYGKHHTDESNIKNRLSHLGKKALEITKLKKQSSMIGKNSSAIKYTFRNKLTNSVFVGTQLEFRNSYKLNASNVCMLVHKNRKSTKNWIVELDKSLDGAEKDVITQIKKDLGY